MNINKKVDLSKLSSEQVMKRGDKILDEDEKSLQNMIKTLNKGKDMIQETKKELYRQMEAMDRMEGDLNETDGSLNRTKKTINYMNLTIAIKRDRRVAQLGSAEHLAAGIGSRTKLVDRTYPERIRVTQRQGQFRGINHHGVGLLGLQHHERERGSTAAQAARLGIDAVLWIGERLVRGGYHLSAIVIGRRRQRGGLALTEHRIRSREGDDKHRLRITRQRTTIGLQFVERRTVLRGALQSRQTNISCSAR